MELPRTHPFDRYGWHGRLISVDGTDPADFADDALDKVIASAQTPAGWDGEVAGVAKLKDGRFVGWETDWGPTGDGFCCDAYGGGADIFVGASADAVIWMGLSASGRTLLGLPAERPDGS